MSGLEKVNNQSNDGRTCGSSLTALTLSDHPAESSCDICPLWRSSPGTGTGHPPFCVNTTRLSRRSDKGRMDFLFRVLNRRANTFVSGGQWMMDGHQNIMISIHFGTSCYQNISLNIERTVFFVRPHDSSSLPPPPPQPSTTTAHLPSPIPPSVYSFGGVFCPISAPWCNIDCSQGDESIAGPISAKPGGVNGAM